MNDTRYGVLIRKNSKDIRCSPDYGVIELSIVEVSPTDKIQNPSHDHEFENLRFRAQWDTNREDERERERTYGWEISYRDVYSVDLDDVNRFAKVLRRARKALETSTVKPVTFGQYVTIVADALGISTVVVESIHSEDSIQYRDRTFNFWSMQDAAMLIDGMIQASREPQAVR